MRRSAYAKVSDYLATHDYITTVVGAEMCGVTKPTMASMMLRWAAKGEVFHVAECVFALDAEKGAAAAERDGLAPKRSKKQHARRIARIVEFTEKNGGFAESDELIALFAGELGAWAVRRVIRVACERGVLIRSNLAEYCLPDSAPPEEFRQHKFPWVREYLEVHGTMDLDDILDVADVSHERIERVVREWVRKEKLVRREDGLFELPRRAEAAE